MTDLLRFWRAWLKSLLGRKVTKQSRLTEADHEVNRKWREWSAPTTTRDP